jgi:hypothetical protein
MRLVWKASVKSNSPAEARKRSKLCPLETDDYKFSFMRKKNTMCFIKRKEATSLKNGD